jgi:hypothetical protein
MKKIGIEIKLIGNIPWIYIDTINDKKVKEKYDSDHRFTIGYTPVKANDQFEFIDLKILFDIIRKYR